MRQHAAGRGLRPALGATAERLTTTLADLRQELGAPWTADHKAATAAALLALAVT